MKEASGFFAMTARGQLAVAGLFCVLGVIGLFLGWKTQGYWYAASALSFVAAGIWLWTVHGRREE